MVFQLSVIVINIIIFTMNQLTKIYFEFPSTNIKLIEENNIYILTF